MNLPDGITYHPRQHLHHDETQRGLIEKNRPALIRIETTERFPHNRNYQIESHKVEIDLAEFLRGDWERFDCDFGFKPNQNVYVRAIHGSQNSAADSQLLDIWVAPNLRADLEKPEVYSFGCTMGHVYPYDRKLGLRIAEVFEFQGYGFLILSRENSEVEIWVAQEGDKVAVPTGCHATLYNLSNDSPLVALSFHSQSQPSLVANHSLSQLYGPILLGYYSSQEVVFKLNRTYVNNPDHRAGVSLKNAPLSDENRTVRIKRGARLDVGRMLYEQLTQNPALIARFAKLGIHVKAASPEAVLEPTASGSRLFFAMPLVNAVGMGTEVYRYFIPEATAAEPNWLKLSLPGQIEDEWEAASQSENAKEPQPLNRPLMIVVEGIGDWVNNTYRPRFKEIMESENPQHKLSVFYADDSRWYGTPERKLDAKDWADGLLDWEVYLDKASPEDYAKYLKLRPDVVFVVTPDFTHSLLARQWLNKSPLVFVEKPFDSQVGNVDDLRRAFKAKTQTEVLGLDHYQFYTLKIEELLPEIRKHLGGAIARIDFYMTEDRPIEAGREKSVQYGLTLDMLPHMLALLVYFGDVTKIDDISVVEAGRYQPLMTAERKASSLKDDISPWFDSETYSRVHFTFQDRSHSGFHIPCTAVVGKGFGSEAKYMELTGISGHAVRIDLKSKPKDDTSKYPWDSIFFLHGQSSNAPKLNIEEVSDPYQPGRLLKVITNPEYRRPLLRERYKDLLLDLLNGTTTAVRSTLTLSQGQSIVRALDRIWWAIRLAKPEWKDFTLEGKQSPFEPVSRSHPTNVALIARQWQSGNEDNGLIQPTRTLGTISMVDESEGDDRPLEPVLTRGPRRLETRLLTTCKRLSVNDLVTLLNDLRSQVRGAPLSLLAHNWKSIAAFEFLSKIMRKLLRDDVVWLVSPDQSPIDSLKSGVEKILDSNHSIQINIEDTGGETSRSVYKNLVADITYLPAVVQNELEVIARFSSRTRIVVIDELGCFHNELQQKARDLGLIVYCWSEEPKPIELLHTLLGQQLSQSPETADDWNKIGRELAGLAKQIANKKNCRLEFKSRISELMDAEPRHASWAIDLARQSYLWPAWAVECLPKLYIELEGPTDKNCRVLIWNELLKWLPNPIVESEAKSEILEMSVPAQTVNLLRLFASILEKNRLRTKLSNERSFRFIVSASIQEIEARIKYQGTLPPEYLEAFKVKRKDYLDKLLASPY